MDSRKWKSGAAVSPPALDNSSDGYASAGNAGTGTPATKPGPHWYHMVGEEIRAAIVAGGLTPDKADVTQLAAAIGSLIGISTPPGGRLTLTTAVPVTVTDVTAATTIYYTPAVHDRVQIYNGAYFANTQFSETSQLLSDSTKSPAAAGNNTNYDMFVWLDSSTVRCTRGPAWSSDTARGTGAGTTELELFQGRYVNKVAITNGPAARRGTYVGTIRTNGSAQCRDSLAHRHCWNAFNQVARAMMVTEPANSWNYSTATFRQSNANAANQLDVVVGLSQNPIHVTAHSQLQNNTGGLISGTTGIGVDSTSVNSAQILQAASVVAANQGYSALAVYRDVLPIGRHTLTWLERVDATGTSTWSGDAGVNYIANGIAGEHWA